MSNDEKLQRLRENVHKGLMECRDKAKAEHTSYCGISIRIVNGEWKSIRTINKTEHIHTQKTEHTHSKDVIKDGLECAVDVGIVNRVSTVSKNVPMRKDNVVISTSDNVPMRNDNVVISTSDDGKSEPVYDVQESMNSHRGANVGFARHAIGEQKMFTDSESDSGLCENSNTLSSNTLLKPTPDNNPTNDCRLQKVGEECFTNEKCINNDNHDEFGNARKIKDFDKNWDAANHTGDTADQRNGTYQGRCSSDKLRLSALNDTPLLSEICGGAKKKEVPAPSIIGAGI